MSKPNIILDLDQTLISGEAVEEYDFENNKKKAKKFNYHNMDSYYVIFERPGLQKFLDFLFNNFNVSVWTAASKDYGLFIIDKIILANKPNRKLDWFFFSYHCNVSSYLLNNTKDLRILWNIINIPNYNENNTVIIDDYDEVYKTQVNNCIIAKPFKFLDDNSENDDYLKKLEPQLIKMKNNIKQGFKSPANFVNINLKLNYV